MKIKKQVWLPSAIVAGIALAIFVYNAYHGRKARNKVAQIAAAEENKPG